MKSIFLIFILFLLFANFSSISFANTIAPTLISHDDHQDPSLPSMIFSFSVDCNSSTGVFYVFDSNLTPIPNVKSFLSYLDYSTPLLSRSTSDSSGKIVHPFVGKTIFMRGLFVWYIEKEGYRPKEVHFDIRSCYQNQSSIPAPPISKPVSVSPLQNQNSSVLMSEPKFWTNTTPNQSSSSNISSKSFPSLICPSSIFLIFFLVIFSILKTDSFKNSN